HREASPWTPESSAPSPSSTSAPSARSGSRAARSPAAGPPAPPSRSAVTTTAPSERGPMKHEFTVAGPIRVQATLRATDLVVAEGAADTVTVLLESSRDASDRGAFVASTVVELVGGVLHLEAPLPRFFSRERTRIRVTLPPGSEIDVGTVSVVITFTVPLSLSVFRSGSVDFPLVESGDLVSVYGAGYAIVSTHS